MDLRHLRYFLAVVEKKHFGHAAESMNVVQSAISQQIKLLEEELGVILLERSRPHVKLTEAGRVFLPECRRVLLQAEQAIRVAKQASAGLTGRLRVGFVDNAMWSLLPPLIRAFRERFAGVDLELLSLDRSAQLAALEDRTIDIALIPNPSPLGDFHSELFAEAPLVVALPANHPLLARSTLTMERLAEHQFVVFPHEIHSRLNELIFGACSAAGFVPKIAQFAAQMHTQLALVGAGFGIAIVPRWVAATNFHNVKYLAVAKPALPYGLRFVWHADSDNGALRNFVSLAREHSMVTRKLERGPHRSIAP